MVPRAKPLHQHFHDAAIREPFTWFMAAESLKRAAIAVLAQAKSDELASTAASVGNSVPAPTRPVYLMLIGFMFENLIKGLRIRRLVTEAPTISTDEIGSRIFSHSLRRLYGEVIDSGPNDAEADLLTRLEDFVRWAGRYPVARSSNENRPRELPNGGWVTPAYTFVQADEKLIAEMTAKLESLV